MRETAKTTGAPSVQGDLGMRRITPRYTMDDYLKTTAPYEELYALRGDPFLHEQNLAQMMQEAEAIGFKGFNRLYRQYIKSKERPRDVVGYTNSTEFSGQAAELDTGEWVADDFGVRTGAGANALEACCHPVMPVERLINIDTGLEKLRIAYSKGKRWREVIVDKSQLASPQKIIALADNGIAVNSENAKALIRYLHDVENLNYDRIPERKSVSRLGYIEGEGFSPFVDGLVFDGLANFRAAFESVRDAGKRDRWMEAALGVRASGSVTARIVLAASFASVLVAPCGALPFFVHLWGGESGTGKTVALMLAASVWANPAPGRYIQTFNSTKVGHEKLAAFYNHLPLMIDELQLSRGAKGKPDFDVYALAEGVGRTRGTRTGGVERTATWANCILTTGESPITTLQSGAGAVNRVIDIECSPSQKVIEDGPGLSAVVKRNYGFAGREFVGRLYGDDGEGTERAQELYKQYFRLLSENDTTEKQAMAASAILAADALATEWIFRDSRALSVEDLSRFLASKAAVSAGARGYEYMCQWVAANANRFETRDSAIDKTNEVNSVPTGEIYGAIEDETMGASYTGNKVAFIIKSVFNRTVEEAGFSASALMSYLKENELILIRGRNLTRGKRIRRVLAECVALRINDMDADDFIPDDLPFGPGEVEQQRF